MIACPRRADALSELLAHLRRHLAGIAQRTMAACPAYPLPVRSYGAGSSVHCQVPMTGDILPTALPNPGGGLLRKVC